MNKFNTFVFLFTLLFFSCSKTTQQEDIITVTIEPQRYFAEQLVDSLFKIVTMVPPGSSPEDYDPTPQQMIQLAKSKAYFCIGHIGFENVWLDKLKQNNPDVLFFDNSEGIDFAFSEHCHGSHEHHDHVFDSGIDPHTWTSPKEVSIIVQNMCNALIEIDSKNAEIYKRNLEKLLDEIKETNQIVENYLNQSFQKSFLIYHPALAYFARDYGFDQYSIEMEGKEPTPAQLKNIIDIAKREKTKVVFIQQEFDKKNAEIIANETGCQLVVINPLSYNWSEEIIRIARVLANE